VGCLAALPNGDIASCSLDGRILISDSNGQVKCVFTAHEHNDLIKALEKGKINEISCAMAVHPNGELASSCNVNARFKITGTINICYDTLTSNSPIKIWTSG
jgi:WD40 repeat protein